MTDPDILKLISLPPRMADLFHRLEGRDPGEWFAGSDPSGRKVGSGGGTACILASAYNRFIEETTGKTGNGAGTGRGFREWLSLRRFLVIHSGGESRRLPAYAPYGKSVLPLPVFRWSKGQSLDQKLLDFQTEFYERILGNAPAGYRILVGSGDVMFISPDRFRNLPEADVLLFGAWVDDETATRHGVFFMKREEESLAFIRQKPSLKELREHAHRYNYLMDSGIVLLSEKAVMELMKRSGWNLKTGGFKEGLPARYDLYGEMFSAFGTEPTIKDPGLSALEVKMVPVRDCEFYHFGTNGDLIGSTLKLQNRISDQRLRLTRETDHHPSIFQQNSVVRINFTNRNSHLWIENSHITEGWKLRHHHVLTGIPSNGWGVSLPAGTCVDMVPMGKGHYGLRTYGFSDGFRDTLNENVQWMNQPLTDWLKARSMDPEEAGILPGASLFDLPLFPVVTPVEVPELLAFICGEGAGSGKGSMATLSRKWLNSARISARELDGNVDIPSLYRQREELMAGSLPGLAANHHKSIFYYLDLERTAKTWKKQGLKLPPPLSPEEPLIKRINDQMFRSRATSGDRKAAKEFEGRAFGMLRNEMISTLRDRPVEPVRKVLDDQILWGRSPVRLDLAGGWTDTPPYCILEGGKVVNLSVELNGQMPLQVFARPLDKPVIVLRSIDLGNKLEVSTYDELDRYDRVGGGFSIPLAALTLAGFGPRFSTGKYPDLESRLKAFGCGIELTLLAAIPKGSGLGTSSNLAATVLGTLSEFCGLNWDKHEISYRTLILEQMLTTGGGWQDQYGGIFEGIKLLETEPGILQQPTIKWLPGQLFTGRDTGGMMLLYYTGITRVAHNILGEIVKGMFLNSSRHLAIFHEMKLHARETFDAILAGDYEGMAAKVARSWELNQRLDEGTNPPSIREIIRRVDDLLLGYKLLGAGGGGYLFICAKSPEAAVRAKKILESEPPNTRARFVDFSISATGFQVSRS